jgi:GNAT superfamily N-acetyltransferase
MDAIRACVDAPGLVEAIEANVAEQYAYFRHAPQAEVHADADLMWYVSGIPIGEYNGVVGTRLAPDATPETVDARVAEVVEAFAARAVPFTWWVGPSTRPADLSTSLERHGLVYAVDLPAMAADLEALADDVPAPGGLVVEEVASAEDLAAWVGVAGAGYGEPEEIQAARLAVHTALGIGADRPLRRYLARLDGEPVAMSALFLDAGVGGVCEVATVPAVRRRGIGSVVTLAPLRAARALGYRVGVLASSPMGLTVYQRLGFREYGTFALYTHA